MSTATQVTAIIVSIDSGGGLANGGLEQLADFLDEGWHLVGSGVYTPPDKSMLMEHLCLS